MASVAIGITWVSWFNNPFTTEFRFGLLSADRNELSLKGFVPTCKVCVWLQSEESSSSLEMLMLSVANWRPNSNVMPKEIKIEMLTVGFEGD